MFRALFSLVVAGFGLIALGAITIAAAVGVAWVLFFLAVFALAGAGAMLG